MKISFSENDKVNFELVDVNKMLLKESNDPSSTMFSIAKIGENASLLVAICPSYSFDFKELSLVDLIPPISGNNLGTLKKLANKNRLSLFVGIFELLTPLTFLAGISETKPQKTSTFPEARKLIEPKALEFETKFMQQEKDRIQYIFSEVAAGENKSDALPQYLLTSEVRKKSEFKEIQEKIKKFYYNVGVNSDRAVDQANYSKAVDNCVGAACQRIFKDFYAAQKVKKIYCLVKDEKTDEVYDLPKFMNRLMVEHLLDEMALVIVAGQKYNIDYFVHYISQQGKKPDNLKMERLLTMTKQCFLSADYANKLFWQPIRFVVPKVKGVNKMKELKEVKKVELTNPPASVIEDLSPVVMRRTSSGNLSDENSSGEDKSPLSSSPPKTFYLERDTVTLARNIYDLIFDLATSSDPVQVRNNLIKTMERDNLDRADYPSPEEEITLKATSYRFLLRLAQSDAPVQKRINLLAKYPTENLPNPTALNHRLTRDDAKEIKKMSAEIPVPKPLNVPASINRSAIFNNPRLKKSSETKQLQPLSYSPPKKDNIRSSSPGLYNSHTRWQRKSSGSNPSTFTSTNNNK